MQITPISNQYIMAYGVPSPPDQQSNIILVHNPNVFFQNNLLQQINVNNHSNNFSNQNVGYNNNHIYLTSNDSTYQQYSMHNITNPIHPNQIHPNQINRPQTVNRLSDLYLNTGANSIQQNSTIQNVNSTLAMLSSIPITPITARATTQCIIPKTIPSQTDVDKSITCINRIKTTYNNFNNFNNCNAFNDNIGTIDTIDTNAKANPNAQSVITPHFESATSQNNQFEQSPKLEDECKYSCNICSKKFKRKTNLNAHAKVHTDYAYLCPYCNKKFARNSNRKQHIRIHTGERPFKCSFCIKAFRQKHSLHDHIRTHTGEKPFGCKFCSMKFAARCNLIVHIRTHTGSTPYQCQKCNKKYASKSGLNAHLKKFHVKHQH